MSQNVGYLYQLVTLCTGVLSMLAYAGGFVTCVVHHRISPWLTLVATGFLGLFLAALTIRLATYLLRPLPDILYGVYIAATMVDVLSTLMLVFGFSLVLVQIRRKLAISMDPPNVRY